MSLPSPSASDSDSPCAHKEESTPVLLAEWSRWGASCVALPLQNPGADIADVPLANHIRSGFRLSSAFRSIFHCFSATSSPRFTSNSALYRFSKLSVHTTIPHTEDGVGVSHQNASPTAGCFSSTNLVYSGKTSANSSPFRKFTPMRCPKAEGGSERAPSGLFVLKPASNNALVLPSLLEVRPSLLVMACTLECLRNGTILVRNVSPSLARNRLLSPSGCRCRCGRGVRRTSRSGRFRVTLIE